MKMVSVNWLKKVLKENTVDRSALRRYYETEGLCRMQTTPQLIVNGAFGGHALASGERQYCVRS
jgi:hypothetical protein